jgi:hypothetical protein
MGSGYCLEIRYLHASIIAICLHQASILFVNPSNIVAWINFVLYTNTFFLANTQNHTLCTFSCLYNYFWIHPV